MSPSSTAVPYAVRPPHAEGHGARAGALLLCVGLCVGL